MAEILSARYAEMGLHSAAEALRVVERLQELTPALAVLAARLPSDDAELVRRVIEALPSSPGG